MTPNEQYQMHYAEIDAAVQAVLKKFEFPLTADDIPMMLTTLIYNLIQDNDLDLAEQSATLITQMQLWTDFPEKKRSSKGKAT
jgi:hypothetical protein